MMDENSAGCASEGADLNALQEAYVLLTEPAGMTEALRKRIDAAQRLVVLSLPAIIAELRAARTPAQTQTFKDGFAAGLEAAAKKADALVIYPVTNEAAAGRNAAAALIAIDIRALKEPS